MDFGLNNEQTALQQTVRSLFASQGHDVLRDAVDKGAGFDRSLWHELTTELGLASVAIDEEYGGAGGTFFDLSIVLEEAGRVLLCQPFFSTAVLGALTLQLTQHHEAKERWLPAIANGDARATFAHRDSEVPAKAERLNSGRWRLTGTKTLVLDAPTADVLLVTATTSDGQGLFAVEGSSSGLRHRDLDALDRTRPLGEVGLADVDALLLCDGEAAEQVIDKALAIARTANTCEQVGAAQACLDLAVEYAKTRVQFGRPIGSFQAIKHLCADMLVDVDTARAAVQFGAWTASDPARDISDLAHHTQAIVSPAFTRVAATTLQILGGIGYTWEHDAHLYYKRALSSARLLGTTDEALESIAESIGLGSSTAEEEGLHA